MCRNGTDTPLYGTQKKEPLYIKTQETRRFTDKYGIFSEGRFIHAKLQNSDAAR